MAASQYPWLSQGIVACLDPQRHQIAQIRDHLQQVRHLLVHDDLSLFPCHSSIFALVSQLPEHQDYRKPSLQKMLFWLQQTAEGTRLPALDIHAGDRSAMGNDAPCGMKQ